MASLLKWIQTPQADSIAKVAEQKAWKTFLAKYPKADKSKFEPQTVFAKDHTATSEIYFKAGPGSFDKCFRFRQQILEPGNEKCAGC